MRLELTAVFRRVPEGYLGWVEELPGANVQEPTLDEARASLDEAVRLVLDANRQLSRQAAAGEEALREAMVVDAV
jgi:predicted RNase H-like HicB family nuclease